MEHVGVCAYCMVEVESASKTEDPSKRVLQRTLKQKLKWSDMVQMRCRCMIDEITDSMKDGIIKILLFLFI